MKKQNITSLTTLDFPGQTARESIRQYPAISVVIIGLNVERYLYHCIQSIRQSNYPQDKLELIYVDSRSIDRSCEIAGQLPEVRLIRLEDDQPNAAKARNAGALHAGHNLIQFVDADSYLHPDWLANAVNHIGRRVVAVAGGLNERYPNRNFFHRMTNLEWNLRWGKQGWSTKDQEANIFGGNVLIRRDLMLASDGYDSNLPAGEDPDLSMRMRHRGLSIRRLIIPMATHDINIGDFRTYFKRTRRTGNAYFQLASRHWRHERGYLGKILIRLIAGAILPPLLITAGILTGQIIPGAVMAAVVALRLVFKTGRFARMFSISRRLAFQYSLHLAMAVYPQFIGLTGAALAHLKQSMISKINSRKMDSLKPGKQFNLVGYPNR